MAHSKPSAAAALAETPTAAQQTSDIGMLLAAVDQGRHSYAVRLFKEMVLASSPNLARIRPELLTDMMRYFVFNEGRAAWNMSVRARMAYAVHIFDLVRSLGVKPLTETFTVAITAHSRLGNVAAIESLLAEMAGERIDVESPAVLSSVMYGCIVAGNEAKGREVFGRLLRLDPSARTHTELMKAYVASGNEARLLEVFGELKASGLGAEAEACSHVCSHYLKVRDYAKVLAYYDEYTNKSGKPEPQLLGAALCAYNKLGQHQRVIEIVKDLPLSRIPVDHKIRTENLIALAAMGDRMAVWHIFAYHIRRVYTNARIETAMARMMGPMTTPAAMADLWKYLRLVDIDQTRAIMAMMKGYGGMGDLASATALYAEIKRPLPRYIETAANKILVHAFEKAGDAAGLEAFKKKIGAQAAASVPPSTRPTAE